MSRDERKEISSYAEHCRIFFIVETRACSFHYERVEDAWWKFISRQDQVTKNRATSDINEIILILRKMVVYVVLLSVSHCTA